MAPAHAGVELMELDEQARHVVRLDADALVLDLQPPVAVPLGEIRMMTRLPSGENFTALDT